MKNLLKKTIKTFPSIIIILGVFVISFIFVNNKLNLNSEVKNIELPNTSSPFYYGVGAKGLASSEVFKLIKVSEGNTIPFTIAVSPVDQVWYFAYPDSYPALKSIKDQNGFELISDFKVTTGNNIINTSGEKITYRIYEYNNVTTLTSYKVTYL